MTLQRTNLVPLERTNLREQIGRVLRAEIVSGELEPGETYTAVTLSQRFGVSATPVREAMVDLAAAGLVEAIPNRGFRIVEFTEEDLIEIVELRIFLEVPGVGKAALNATAEDVKRLQATCTEMEKAAKKGQLRPFLVADRAFHLGLLGLSHNSRLVDLVAHLRDQSRLFGLQSVERSVLIKLAVEHMPILTAVAERKPKQAEALMRAHLENAYLFWSASGVKWNDIAAISD